MLDVSRDLAPHQPIRLADYQAPSFLIDAVDLVPGKNTFSLWALLKALDLAQQGL